jgi:hypothetical protein
MAIRGKNFQLAAEQAGPANRFIDGKRPQKGFGRREAQLGIFYFIRLGGSQ